jgi:hypothetical protein
VRVAGHLDDARRGRAWVGQVQAVVPAEGIGLQVALVVGEELLRAVALAIDREVEPNIYNRAFTIWASCSFVKIV